MRVVVCGGAGYIGAHVVRHLADHQHDVLVYDNLSTGHSASVTGTELVVGDVSDTARLCDTLHRFRADAVIHLAAKSVVGESMQNPGWYFRENVGGALSLLNAMVKTGVDRLVFSSTAAVYGEPIQVPINESHPLRPTNVYGETKRMVEHMAEWYARIYGLKAVFLRYFNAAGAHQDGHIGEAHHPETHLIPIVLQAAQGLRPVVTVFGTDYPTPDGTAIRDYVHVMDLADAHERALAWMKCHNRSGTFNLGVGKGYSVNEIIHVVREETGREFPVVFGERRAGDPAVLVADGRLAREELGWEPRFSSLKQIVSSAWSWHLEHPSGYEMGGDQ